MKEIRKSTFQKFKEYLKEMKNTGIPFTKSSGPSFEKLKNLLSVKKLFFLQFK